MSNKREVFLFYGTLQWIRTHVSGSCRVEIDCSKDCYEVAQRLQALQLEKGHPIAIAAVPIEPGDPLPNVYAENFEDPTENQSSEEALEDPAEREQTSHQERLNLCHCHALCLSNTSLQPDAICRRLAGAGLEAKNSTSETEP